MADMDAIMAIAEKYGLIVIEDSAHAHGAKWRGKGAGTIGHFGSFSLQSSKILTTGEGGVLICRTPELAAKAASIVDCGRSHEGEDFSEGGTSFTMGANYRMTELQAALGLAALERFPEQVKQRAELANYADDIFSKVPGVRVLPMDERQTTRSFYRYVFAIDEEAFGSDHQAVSYALNMEGIPSWEGYEAMQNYDLFHPERSNLPVPKVFPEYFKFDEMKLPVAEKACEHEAIWLDERIFRSDRKGIDDVVTALQKIQAHKDTLARIADEYRKAHPDEF
jgi:dTDP-4-amino-4,6-dideoxygalactose transaminase